MLDEFISWALARAGLRPEAYRAHALNRRLAACLRALKVHDTDQARKLLQKHRDCVPAAVDALLIGVTEFFRDKPVFDAIARDIVPALDGRGRPPRIWSAGCSCGQELYSIAILLARAGGLEGAHLLGTDCRTDCVERAGKSMYDAHAMSLVDAETRGEFFKPSAGGRWTPRRAIRDSATWKVADFLTSVEPGPWDLILWRNAAIYLNADFAAATWRAMAGELAPDGVIVAGKAERPPASCRLKCVAACIYRNAASPAAIVDETRLRVRRMNGPAPGQRD